MIAVSLKEHRVGHIAHQVNPGIVAEYGTCCTRSRDPPAVATITRRRLPDCARLSINCCDDDDATTVVRRPRTAGVYAINRATL